MAEAQNDHSEAMTTRDKAEQDLKILRERIRDHELKLVELKAEQDELTAFLRRLERYEPARAPAASAGGGEPSVLSTKVRIDIPRLRPVPRGLFGGGVRATSQLDHQSLIKALGEPIVTGADMISEDLRRAIGSRITYSPKLHLDHALLSGEIPRADSRRGQVNGFVYNVMAKLGDGVPTRDLVDFIRRDDTLLSFLGARPDATLSSYLSRDPRFAFHRERGGWVLTERMLETVLGDQDGEDAEPADQEGGQS